MKFDFSKVFTVFKGFLSFAQAAAPVAADVAKLTGHEDVVEDINKAGAAAEIVDKGFGGSDDGTD